MKYTFSIYFFLIFAATLKAQTFDLGSGIQIYKFDGELLDTEMNTYIPVVAQQRTSFTAIFSANIPYKKLNEDASLGICPNFSLGATSGLLSVDVPVYATLKWGMGSHENNTRRFGAAIGLGYMFSLYSTHTFYFNRPYNLSGTYFSPGVMIEAGLEVDGRVYKLRVDFLPVPYSSIKETFIGDISQLNIRFLRGLN